MTRWVPLALITFACTSPKQLGGLGVYNPNGVENRLCQREQLDESASGRVCQESASTRGFHAKSIKISKQ